jgi:cytochrome c-type biogenesis protein CcmF
VLIDLAKAWWAHERSIGALVRLIDSNHRRYGGQLVHMGVLMIIAGIVGSSVFGHKEHFQLTPGQEVAFGGQKLKYVAMHETRHANYSAVQAEMLFTDANGNATTLRPQRRFYDKSEQPHTEVALSMDLKRDVYLTLAGWEKSGAVTAIEAIINPLVSWIWIGGIVMSVGAIFCMIPKILSQPAVVTAAEDDQNSLRVARLAVKA